MAQTIKSSLELGLLHFSTSKPHGPREFQHPVRAEANSLHITFRNANQILEVVSITTISHMIMDTNTDVHFSISAGMRMLQARECNAPLPPPENAKWKCQTLHVELCAHSF